MDTRHPLSRAVLGLIGTGLLAGGAVYAGLFFSFGQTVLTPVIAAGGIAASLWLLARAWRPLATRRGQSAGRAVALTGFLLIGTTLTSLYLVGGPYTQQFCPWETAEICSVDALVTMHTAGLVVPWTLAGLPGLLLLSIRNKPALAGE